MWPGRRKKRKRRRPKLPGPVYVVKSQIHAGGRGAGRFTNDPNGKGGVRVVKSAADVKAAAAAMIGHTLVTKQTGPQGKVVSRVYVEDGCDIKRELYLGLLVDRDSSRVTIMASTEGGMEIEEVAEHHPEKILKVAIDPASGISGFHSRKLAFGLGLTGKQVGSFTKFVTALYGAFQELDCAIVEINPLVVTGAGEIVALDAKVSFDDNALFRHKDLEALRDDSEMDPKELEAVRNDLNYVALDGEIGCMVNGAGLAMATMDIIKLYGSSPGQLPRCRRHRERGAGDRGVPDHHLGQQRQGDPGQHLRRHRQVRHDRRGDRGRGQDPDAVGCPSWCGSRAPMSTSARRSWPIAASPSSPPTTWPTPRRRLSPRLREPEPWRS